MVSCVHVIQYDVGDSIVCLVHYVSMISRMEKYLASRIFVKLVNGGKHLLICVYVYVLACTHLLTPTHKHTQKHRLPNVTLTFCVLFFLIQMMLRQLWYDNIAIISGLEGMLLSCLC